jgi:hypothetical protein
MLADPVSFDKDFGMAVRFAWTFLFHR